MSVLVSGNYCLASGDIVQGVCFVNKPDSMHSGEDYQARV